MALDKELSRIPNYGTEKKLQYIYQIKISSQE